MHGCDALLEGLTQAQREAVTAPDGPMLVLAGPGSGKTTVVTRRIAALLARGTSPWSILALTFTNKAAGAMRERVRALGGGSDVRGMTISTFHSFAASQLRRLGERAGVHEQFSIWDTSDQRSAMKQAIVDAGLSTGNWTPASVLAAISSWKNRLQTVTDMESTGDDFYTRNLSRAWRAYERILTSARALDFDDLLLKLAVALRDDVSVRDQFTQRWTSLLVDEYQDTNHAQFVIAASIASGHGNICVVGDPDQSIYAWRGADIGNILQFESAWSGARVVNLGVNFRSTGRIVAAAAGLIGHNATHRSREHVAAGDTGEPVVLLRAPDEHEEAHDIVERMREHHDRDGVPWREMAVLYRMNALSRVLEEAFRDADVPHVVARGTAFYDRKEIRDALAMLRVVLNPRDDVALRRIVNTPPRGIGATTMDAVERSAARHDLPVLDAMRQAVETLGTRARKATIAFLSMVDGWRCALDEGLAEADMASFVAGVIAESGLEDHLKGAGEEEQERLENLEELISAAADRDADTRAALDDEAPPLRQRLENWLESIALVSDADAIDPEQGAVTLMTLHAAKGLEFDVVAIIALEQGILPHSRSSEDPAQLEEERRLCYVGMTRARRHLMMTRAMVRTQRGIRERAAGSGFLDEVPAAEVRHIEPEPPWGSSMDDVPVFRQETEGDAVVRGAFVRHPRFGVGQVQRVLQRPQGTTATINFDDWGPRTLYVSRTSLDVIDPEDVL